MCLMEMSTISKTNPNSNQSSKTNDGLNPVADLPPISTLTPPVTIYGVSPQLYIGQNGSSRSTFSYSTSVFQITTQDNSFLKLDATTSYLNRNLTVYTSTTASVNVGVSSSNTGTIQYAEYAPSQWLLQLITQYGTTLQLQDGLVVVNKDVEVLKDMGLGGITFTLQNLVGSGANERNAVFRYTEIVPGLDDEGAQLEISVPSNSRVFPNTPGSTINLLQDKININNGAGKLEVTPTLTYTTTNFTLYKASTTIDLVLQNNTVTAPTERKATIEYFETGNPGDEGGALSLSIPANSRRAPATAGAGIQLFDDEILLKAKEVQFQDTLLNASSYLYLNSFKTITNTQPAPESWVPKFVFTTALNGSAVYTTRYGKIWKYGNLSYVSFRILATLTITGATNIRIRADDPLFSFPLITNPSKINMGPTSTIAGTRFDVNSFSELGQTNPDWIVTILANGAGFPAHAAYVPGVSSFGVDFYGDGFLCHA